MQFPIRYPCTLSNSLLLKLGHSGTLRLGIYFRLFENLHALPCSYVDKALVLGMLSGNRFTITLRLDDFLTSSL